eukprot:5556000-Amphidinium_carterae.1
MPSVTEPLHIKWVKGLAISRTFDPSKRLASSPCAHHRQLCLFVPVAQLSASVDTNALPIA